MAFPIEGSKARTSTGMAAEAGCSAQVQGKGGFSFRFVWEKEKKERKWA